MKLPLFVWTWRAIWFNSFDDHFNDADYSAWTVTQEWGSWASVTETWTIIKALSYGSWGDWHWARITKSIIWQSWDWEAKFLINWSNNAVNAMWQLQMGVGLDNGDTFSSRYSDGHPSYYVKQRISLKNWVYITNDILSTQYSVTWQEIKITKVWTTVTFYIDDVQFWATSTTSWNINEVYGFFTQLSNYAPLPVQEIDRIQINNI